MRLLILVILNALGGAPLLATHAARSYLQTSGRSLFTDPAAFFWIIGLSINGLAELAFLVLDARSRTTLAGRPHRQLVIGLVEIVLVVGSVILLAGAFVSALFGLGMVSAVPPTQPIEPRLSSVVREGILGTAIVALILQVFAYRSRGRLGL